ncbi:hypothetical protein ACFYUK_18870 [Nonomuraea wenchangensis]
MSGFTRKVVDDEAEGGRTSLVHYLLTGEHGTVEVLLMQPPAGVSTLGWETGGWHDAGIAYHAPFRYQDAQEFEPDCEYVPGGRCYYGVINSHPEELVRRWWDAGRDDEVIWEAAEDRYLTFFIVGRELLAKAFDDQEAGQ